MRSVFVFAVWFGDLLNSLFFFFFFRSVYARATQNKAILFETKELGSAPARSTGTQKLNGLVDKAHRLRWDNSYFCFCTLLFSPTTVCTDGFIYLRL